jgi:hypothetical protein
MALFLPAHRVLIHEVIDLGARAAARCGARCQHIERLKNQVVEGIVI